MLRSVLLHPILLELMKNSGFSNFSRVWKFFPCVEIFRPFIKWGVFNFVQRFEEPSSCWSQKYAKCCFFCAFSQFYWTSSFARSSTTIGTSVALWWIKLRKCTIKPKFWIFLRSDGRALFKSLNKIENSPFYKKSKNLHTWEKFEKIRIFQQFKENRMQLNETNREIYKTLRLVSKFYCFSKKWHFPQFQIQHQHIYSPDSQNAMRFGHK